MLTICVAMDENGLIGKNNTLPWHLPADLKHFRAITMGKPIVMGHRTYKSIGHPLNGRTNIVISRNQNLTIAGCQVLNSLDAVLKLSQSYTETVVIGGMTIYKILLPYVQKMYITKIHAKFDGDTYFPDYKPEQWQEVERQDLVDEKYSYSFITLRKNPT
ncbi:dihydrofolate reductase [Candidatus Halobeggiatoa sp. HSG11]|nr:dihydrofolate reductase [Candidatus Halobeggiatoa sp. HSG11]